MAILFSSFQIFPAFLMTALKRSCQWVKTKSIRKKTNNLKRGTYYVGKYTTRRCFPVSNEFNLSSVNRFAAAIVFDSTRRKWLRVAKVLDMCCAGLKTRGTGSKAVVTEDRVSPAGCEETDAVGGRCSWWARNKRDLRGRNEWTDALEMSTKHTHTDIERELSQFLPQSVPGV